MNIIIPTVALLLFKGDKVLLTMPAIEDQDLQDSWGLPGGKLNKDEAEIDAVIRYAQDELGLILQPDQLLMVPQISTAQHNHGTNEVTHYVKSFVVKYAEGEISPSEGLALEWVQIKELEKHKTLPGTANTIQKGLKYRERNQ